MEDVRCVIATRTAILWFELLQNFANPLASGCDQGEPPAILPCVSLNALEGL